MVRETTASVPRGSRWLPGVTYRRVVVMRRALDGGIPDITPGIPVRIGMLSGAEVADYVRFRPEVDAREVQGRLERGERCFAIWHEGAIVHAGWAVTRGAWIEFLSCEFPLAPGDVYQFGSYTLPAFRGRDLATARIVWMARFFHGLGLQRLFAVVWPGNTAGFRPLEKAGYQRCGELRMLRVGPWRRIIDSSRRRR
jgi:RimJ/RimL family protein N-acetyltransferase